MRAALPSLTDATGAVFIHLNRECVELPEFLAWTSSDNNIVCMVVCAASRRCVEMVLVVQTMSYINYELDLGGHGLGHSGVLCATVAMTFRVPRG